MTVKLVTTITEMNLNKNLKKKLGEQRSTTKNSARVS